MMKDEFSINLAEENESLGFDFKEQYVAGTSDYNKLKNKPTLNGKEIIGAMKEEDPTVSGWAKEPTKPNCFWMGKRTNKAKLHGGRSRRNKK